MDHKQIEDFKEFVLKMTDDYPCLAPKLYKDKLLKFLETGKYNHINHQHTTTTHEGKVSKITYDKSHEKVEDCDMLDKLMGDLSKQDDIIEKQKKEINEWKAKFKFAKVFQTALESRSNSHLQMCNYLDCYVLKDESDMLINGEENTYICQECVVEADLNECEECDKWYSDLLEFGSRVMCQGCFDENWTYCENFHCGSEVHNDNVWEGGHGRLCKSCAGAYDPCCECDKYVLVESLIEGKNGMPYCEECLPEDSQEESS